MRIDSGADESSIPRFVPGTAADLERFLSGIYPHHSARPLLLPEAADALEDSLRFISIGGANIGDNGLKILVESPRFITVRALCVECCGLSDTGIQYLADSPHVKNLRELYLCNRTGVAGTPNEISDAGAIALASSPHLTKLERLDLWKTNVGDVGWEALIVSAQLSHLSSVNAWETHLTKEGAARIKELSRQRWSNQTGAAVIYSCAIHTDYDERLITYTDDSYS